MVKRLIENKMNLPVLQVPIYPWLNLVDFTYPSQICNLKSDWTEVGDVYSAIIYSGINYNNITQEMVDAIRSSQHLLLINDTKLRSQYLKYIDYGLMPQEYKTVISCSNYSQYIIQHDLLIKNLSSPLAKLSDKSILFKNKNFAQAALKLLNTEATLSFLDDEILKSFPETYMIIVEHDEIRDENFIFSERLKANGVKVKVSYYQTGYHGILADIFTSIDAMTVFTDIVTFLKKRVT